MSDQSLIQGVRRCSRHLAILILLVTLTPVAWGETQESTDAEPAQVASEPATISPEAADDAWLKVNEEPREVGGYIVVAVIFNLSLVALILWVLYREWKKPRPKKKEEPEQQAGS